jgi:hypothetical protein
MSLAPNGADAAQDSRSIVGLHAAEAAYPSPAQVVTAQFLLEYGGDLQFDGQRLIDSSCGTLRNPLRVDGRRCRAGNRTGKGQPFGSAPIAELVETTETRKGLPGLFVGGSIQKSTDTSTVVCGAIS